MRHSVLFIFVFSFLAESASCQQTRCNSCIEWSTGRRLSWEDFRGRPKRSSPNEAMTDSGMSISLNCDGDRTQVKVVSFFNPKKSWTKDHRSSYLLAHEQLHFDITELFVRRLRKQLAALGNDCKRLNDHIEEYYNENYRELVRYQAAYDRETRHSVDREAQQRWQRKVAAELGKLKAYSTP